MDESIESSIVPVLSSTEKIVGHVINMGKENVEDGGSCILE